MARVIISTNDAQGIAKSIVETLFECIANGELSVHNSNPTMLPVVKEEWVDIVSEGIDWWIDSEEEVKEIDWKDLWSKYKEFYMIGTSIVSGQEHVGIFRWIEEKIKEQQHGQKNN